MTVGTIEDALATYNRATVDGVLSRTRILARGLSLFKEEAKIPRGNL